MYGYVWVSTKDLQFIDTIGGNQGIVTEVLDKIVDHRENGFNVVNNENPGLPKVCRLTYSELIYLIPSLETPERAFCSKRSREILHL